MKAHHLLAWIAVLHLAVFVVWGVVVMIAR
jgi:hypothetical protein